MEQITIGVKDAATRVSVSHWTIRQWIKEGRLPAVSKPKMRHSMVLRRACTHTPPALVMAAKRRSVPTALTGGMPNKNTKSGVMSEPPPTPVKPTRKPTTKPESVYAQSIQ